MGTLTGDKCRGQLDALLLAEKQLLWGEVRRELFREVAEELENQ